MYYYSQFDCYNPLNAIITNDCLHATCPSSHCAHKLRRKKNSKHIVDDDDDDDDGDGV